MFGLSRLEKEVACMSRELRYQGGSIDSAISSCRYVSERVSELEKKQQQTTEVLALADITEEYIEKNMLKKLGPGWDIMLTFQSILYPGRRTYTLYKPSGYIFSTGENKIDMLRNALKKKEEALEFCDKPKKKSKKGGK